MPNYAKSKRDRDFSPLFDPPPKVAHSASDWVKNRSLGHPRTEIWNHPINDQLRPIKALSPTLRALDFFLVTLGIFYDFLVKRSLLPFLLAGSMQVSTRLYSLRGGGIS